MKPEKLLHRGFDKLDIAFKCALAPNDIEILEAALIEARTSYKPVLVEIGPGKVAMHIAESGLKGGYAFRGDTGPQGETWTFKRGLSRDEWNVRVSVKSLTLATLGLDAIRDHIFGRLENLGLGHAEESIGRVDYAIDYLMPPWFELNPGHFVSHSKTTKREHASGQPMPTSRSPLDLITHWAGRTAESITIGKMPGQQVIVYDKRREAVRHQKVEWFQIWGVDPEDVSLPIWRIELRAGKACLKDWNIRRFDIMEKRLGDLFQNVVESSRHVVPIDTEKNVSRWPDSRLWRQVAVDLKEGLAENFDGSIRGRIVTGHRERIFEQYRHQILGMLPGLLISKGLTEEQAFASKGDILRELAREVDGWKGGQFRQRLAQTRKRLHFI